MPEHKVEVESVTNFLKNLKSHEQLLCSHNNYRTNKKLVLFFNVNGLRYCFKIYKFGKLIFKTEDITQEDIKQAVNKYNSIV